MLDVEYRVVVVDDKDFGGYVYQVCEVLFDSNTGKPVSFSPTSLGKSEFLDQIESDIRRIEYALNEPVLYQCDFEVQTKGVLNEPSR